MNHNALHGSRRDRVARHEQQTVAVGVVYGHTNDEGLGFIVGRRGACR